MNIYSNEFEKKYLNPYERATIKKDAVKNYEQVKELKKENEELSFLIGQYRDGRTHDEIQEGYRLHKENIVLKKENEELKDYKFRYESCSK